MICHDLYAAATLLTTTTALAPYIAPVMNTPARWRQTPTTYPQSLIIVVVVVSLALSSSSVGVCCTLRRASSEPRPSLCNGWLVGLGLFLTGRLARLGLDLGLVVETRRDTTWRVRISPPHNDESR